MVKFGNPLRKLKIAIIRCSGRSRITGHLVVSGRGGGLRNHWIFLDFFRSILEVPGKVRKIIRDFHRTGFIGLVIFRNGFISCVLLPEGLGVGGFLINTKNVHLRLGNSMPLNNFPVGSIISLVQARFRKPAQYIRAAGSFAKILKQGDNRGTLVQLPSGEERWFSPIGYAMLGTVSNSEYRFQNLGKAGKKRLLGFRPKVRGVAKNPVDHPHGGGEGKTSGGRLSVSPWGRLAKGGLTRRVRRSTVFIEKSR